eukprot:7640388-Pyramimonas_sp.AAC.1
MGGNVAVIGASVDGMGGNVDGTETREHIPEVGTNHRGLESIFLFRGTNTESVGIREPGTREHIPPSGNEHGECGYKRAGMFITFRLDPHVIGSGLHVNCHKGGSNAHQGIRICEEG